MSKIKGMSMVAAAAMLVAGQAYATTINVSGANGEPTLQDVLDSIAVDGDSFIDVNQDQVSPSAYWSVGGSGGSFSRMIIEIAGHAAFNSFGVFDAADSSSQVELFSGDDGGGTSGLFGFGDSGEVFINFADTGVTFADNLFGFYLDTPDGLFYSAQGLNSDGEVHMVGFQGNDQEVIDLPGSQAGTWQPAEYIFGWEDLPASQWDADYNDFVVIIESIEPVPEPSALAMLGLGLIGLGFGARKARRDHS